MAALLLSGCAADDAGKTAKLIDPAGNGSVVEGVAPSAGWPAENRAKSIYIASQASTKYTDLMEWDLVGGLFISEEISFVVPPQWRENFELRITQIKGAANIRIFNFYFMEYGTELEVEILRLEAVKIGTNINVDRLGGEILGYSADESYAYLRFVIAIEPNEQFQSGQIVYDILKVLESDSFEIEIVA